MSTYITIENRKIGLSNSPLVIAEIGINHGGSFKKAVKMVDDAAAVGCECVKFQCHIIEDEMIPNDVIPGNARESIWKIMDRCKLTEEEDRKLKEYTERKGMIYLSTPFSRAAADRLEKMNVEAYKIGSGECNNYPLIEHIARFGKPVILSTGMNDIKSVKIAVEIIKKHQLPFIVMHCTSVYPTPYDKIRLGALADLQENFPDAVIGLSDHSVGNYSCFAAIALGASVVEKHFTSSKKWPGPDISISIDPKELKDLIEGSNAIYKAIGGKKTILKEEEPTISFAYASVVSIREIKKGERFTRKNIWVKRPGTGYFQARDYETLLGKKAKRIIFANTQISKNDI